MVQSDEPEKNRNRTGPNRGPVFFPVAVAYISDGKPPVTEPVATGSVKIGRLKGTPQKYLQNEPKNVEND